MSIIKKTAIIIAAVLAIIIWFVIFLRFSYFITFTREFFLLVYILIILLLNKISPKTLSNWLGTKLHQSLYKDNREVNVFFENILLIISVTVKILRFFANYTLLYVQFFASLLIWEYIIELSWWNPFIESTTVAWNNTVACINSGKLQSVIFLSLMFSLARCGSYLLYLVALVLVKFCIYLILSFWLGSIICVIFFFTPEEKYLFIKETYI